MAFSYNKLMNDSIIAKASEIINAKTGYIGGGMGGYAALALIDENGYPTASTLTIAKADGIKWLTFNTSLGRDSVKRVSKCNRASVCINSSEYNITLVGTVEVLTELETKEDMWFPGMEGQWSGYDDPEYCVLRFTTERYSLFVGYEEAKGTLEAESTGKTKQKEKKSALSFEPILIYNNGQCAKAMELYQKAFDAEITVVGRYSDENPDDVPYKENQKDLIFNAQMRIGNQTILLADDITNNTRVGNHLQIVVEFDTDEGVKSAYGALSHGATDLLAPHSTDYSSCVAGLTDAYGIPWQLMVWHGY